jgi:hypothetical protein
MQFEHGSSRVGRLALDLGAATAALLLLVKLYYSGVAVV